MGHLFQGRYRAIVCDKDAYLLELIRYIHFNPVRARIVKEPEDYVWTGHLGNLSKGGDGLIDEGFVLDQLSDNKSMARRRYRQFVWEGVASGHERKCYQVKAALPWERISSFTVSEAVTKVGETPSERQGVCEGVEAPGRGLKQEKENTELPKPDTLYLN